MADFNRSLHQRFIDRRVLGIFPQNPVSCNYAGNQPADFCSDPQPNPYLLFKTLSAKIGRHFTKSPIWCNDTICNCIYPGIDLNDLDLNKNGQRIPGPSTKIIT